MQKIILKIFQLYFILITSLIAFSQEQYVDSLLESTQNLPDFDKRRYDVYCQIAELSSDADTIIFYSDLAIIQARELDISLAQALTIKGYGYLQSGHLALALDYFFQAAMVYEDENKNSGLATTYDNISSTYSHQQNHKNAILYQKKAIKIFRDEKDSARLASSLNNLAYEYYITQKYDSSLVIFSESRSIYQNLGLDIGVAYCIGNSGLVYSRQKKFDEAENSLLEAISILEKYGDDYAIADFMREYSYVLKQKGELEKSIKYARESFRIANRNSLIDLKSEAAKQLSETFGSIERYDSAYYYQSLYLACNDSIRNLETVQKMADLRTEFEVAQKQSEVDALEKRKLLQTIIIAALVLIIILAVATIYIYYTSLQKNRKLTRILDERRKQLEKQSAELRELNHIKDRFFSIISHDLRGPISSLGGVSFMIKESLEQKNPALLNDVTDYIDQNVVSLTSLLENLLNWALNQQGQFPFKEEVLDAGTLINETVKSLATLAITKDIKVDLEIDDDLPISGDRNTLLTVFRNLLSNAIKFTNTGGSVRIESHKVDPNIAEIVVKDTGIGIPPEKVESLFKLSGDKSTRGTKNEKGIGLGLSLVKEFVTLNKGTIDVSSVVGQGTSFMIRFPLKA